LDLPQSWITFEEEEYFEESRERWYTALEELETKGTQLIAEATGSVRCGCSPKDGGEDLLYDGNDDWLRLFVGSAGGQL